MRQIYQLCDAIIGERTAASAGVVIALLSVEVRDVIMNGIVIDLMIDARGDLMNKDDSAPRKIGEGVCEVQSVYAHRFIV